MRNLTVALGNVRSKIKGQPVQRAPILEDIEDVLRRLGENQQHFDMASDEDLIDSIIYEKTALLKRYTYLLKTARAQGVRVGAFGARLPQEETACLTPYASGGSL